MCWKSNQGFLQGCQHDNGGAPPLPSPFCLTLVKRKGSSSQLGTETRNSIAVVRGPPTGVCLSGTNLAQRANIKNLIKGPSILMNLRLALPWDQFGVMRMRIGWGSSGNLPSAGGFLCSTLGLLCPQRQATCVQYDTVTDYSNSMYPVLSEGKAGQSVYIRFCLYSTLAGLTAWRREAVRI